MVHLQRSPATGHLLWTGAHLADGCGVCASCAAYAGDLTITTTAPAGNCHADGLYTGPPTFRDWGPPDNYCDWEWGILGDPFFIRIRYFKGGSKMWDGWIYHLFDLIYGDLIVPGITGVRCAGGKLKGTVILPGWPVPESCDPYTAMLTFG